MASAKKDAHDTSIQLAESQAALEAANKTQADLQTERDGLKTERDSLVSERDGLVSERDGLSADKEGLVTERDALTVDLEKLQTELDDAKKRIAVLESELAAAKEAAGLTGEEAAVAAAEAAGKLTAMEKDRDEQKVRGAVQQLERMALAAFNISLVMLIVWLCIVCKWRAHSGSVHATCTHLAYD